MFLEFIVIAIATTLATVGVCTFWPVRLFYEIYRPIVLFIGGYLLGVSLLWIYADLVGRIVDKKDKEYNKPSVFARNMLVRGIAFINLHARIKVRIKGKDKFPRLGRFLLVANHKSKFDPMIITAIYGKRDIAFLTKRANMKIPLGGRLMHRCCFLPLDREDKLQSLEQMKKATSLIERDVSSVGVFPEGTRTDDNVVLGEFHEGTFNIAYRAQCPVVVVTFKNTELIHKNFPRPATKVEMNIIRTIPYEEFRYKTAKQLSDEVHEMMLKDLSK